MMTPKEKAEELVNKFNNPDRTNYPYTNLRPLWAIDNIRKSNKI